MSMTFEEAIAQLRDLRIDRKAFEDPEDPGDVFTRDIEALDTILREWDRMPTWVDCNERMPENAGKPGAFCAKHLIMTKFGITEGWFNPDFDCWFALVWFYTSRFLEEEISMERADVPKVCRLPKSYVTHWRRFPDSPHGGGTYEKD